MEHDNGNGTVEGKFTSNVSYDKSVDVFDFGKKIRLRLSAMFFK